MSIDNLKQKAIDGASKMATSPAAMKLLANPQVQRAFLSMMNANADLREWLDGQLKTAAKSMSLVTNEEIGRLRREHRDQAAELEALVDRTDRLETRIGAIETAAKKSAARTRRATTTRKAQAAKTAAKAPAKKAPAKKAPAKKTATKSTTAARKTATRARKPAAKS